VRAHPALLAAAADRGVNQTLLDLEQFGGGVVALPDGVLADHTDGTLGEEPIGQLLQLGGADRAGGLGGQPPPDRAQHLPAGERGGQRGESFWAGQPVKRGRDGPLGQSCRRPGRRRHRTVLSRRPARCCWRRVVVSRGPGRAVLAGLLPPGHLAHQALRLVPEVAGLVLPAAIQGLGGLVGLGRAGLMHHLLHQLGRAVLAVGLLAFQLGADLLVALGEPPPQLLGHPLDGAVAPPIRRLPFDSERPGQLLLVGGLIHRVRGRTVVEQVAGVQRAPLAVRPLGAVGDDHVRVQQRIAGPRGAVGEPHRQQARPLHMLGTMPPGAGANLAVEVGDRSAHPGLMRLRHLTAGGLVSEGVQDRHVLVRS
jgi:hypothetical protein